MTSGFSEPTDCSLIEPVRRHYRVPRENLATLIEPDFAQATDLAREQNEQFRSEQTVVWGRPLAEWRGWARRECLEQAFCYTADLHRGNCQELAGSLPDWSAPLIVTGHQPELYHPGVWLKNSVSSQLAAHGGGLSLNVTVDSDTVKNRGVMIPAGQAERVSFRRVPVDEWPLGKPWQEIGVVNREMFTTFPARVLSQMLPLESEPVLPEFWQTVQRSLDDHPQRGVVSALIAARHQLERQLGVTNLEVPLSKLCETGVFRRFLAHLILDAADFRKVYNSAFRQ